METTHVRSRNVIIYHERFLYSHKKEYNKKPGTGLLVHIIRLVSPSLLAAVTIYLYPFIAIALMRNWNNFHFTELKREFFSEECFFARHSKTCLQFANEAQHAKVCFNCVIFFRMK